MAGCIGPFYNPYPLSKLVAKVGQPLKLNTMSDQEKINEETKTENSDEVNTNKENNSVGGMDIFTDFPILLKPLKSLNILSFPEIKGVR